MKKYNTKLSLAAALLTLPALMLAQPTPANSAAQNLVNKLTKGQATIVKQFPAVAGLQGFVLTPKSKAAPAGPGSQSIVYTDKTGQFLLAGTIINKDGQNISEQDMNKYIYAPLSPKILAAAAKTHWLYQGDPKAPHKIYVLAEPNCSACHLLYQQLLPMIKSKQLGVRWIFVAFLRPTSPAQVATIFQAKDPVKAFENDESKFDMSKELGGAKPAKTITDLAKQQLKSNQDFMRTSGFSGTPAIMFTDKQGKPQVVRGFMRGKALTDKMMTAAGKY